MLNLLREMLHSPVLDIVQRLKHSTGMTVTELCTAMKMSYMGVKQHCVELEKAGFLDTWRRPKAAGRPEKLYRLTPKADALFAGGVPDLTMDVLTTAERVYGESAPPKLLYTYFQSKGEAWAAKLAKATTLEERARLLARLRSGDGCMSAVETDAHGRLVLVEHHRPLRELAARYAIVDELECELIERLIGCEVRRSVEEVSGLVRVTFLIKTTAHTE
ncbi:helix-turn-helix transcriptional regulator [Prosthecobacter fluviatilis]|uniref:Helix-turn-helix transcriptional regulator n=1 Tax=Prosthecobacter fluviatilis TaxID=445931 RepID=A0ABW0KJU3_9BACT